MKKVLKLVVVIFFVFILCGCDVRSDVTVNSDGTVIESVDVLDSNSSFKSDKYSKDEMISFALENYKTVLDFRKYSYVNIEGDSKSGVRSSKQYKNICKYFQDTAFNQYVYKHIKCVETDSYYEIYNDTEYIPYCEDCSNWPRLDTVTLQLNLPIKADEHNADSVNNNTYIWNFGKNAKENKSFRLKISKESLKQSHIDETKRNDRIKTQGKIITIAIIMGVIVGLFSLAMVLYKKYKENQIDY